MAKYTIPPFSHPDYWKNHEQVKNSNWPCCICGKSVTPSKDTVWAIVIDGGATWGDENSPEDAGHMGGFPVGPNCHKKYLIK